MKLEDLGYNNIFQKFIDENNLNNFEIGRVILEHKERYVVKTETRELDAEITGNLRFAAKSREEFPAVGDWVALTIHDSDFSLIHSILPRQSIISREASGKYAEKQIIATNIDYSFLVQSADRDFNINRLERYLTICNSSNVNSIIVLTKTDLIDQHKTLEIVEKIKSRIKNVSIITISNTSREGIEKLLEIIEKGKTYCMLGSSGVGKSTLLNNLTGQTLMRTDSISQSTNKGKHVTSHRELVVLEGGGILIDNPGMREVGIADSSIGLENTFDKITNLSYNCKFKNCTHTNERGCAVIAAVKRGEIDAASYENYLRLEREKSHFESTLYERRQKDKEFGKMLKNIKKNKNNY